MATPIFQSYWNVADFPRLSGENDDTNRIQRAVNAALSLLRLAPGTVGQSVIDTQTVARVVYCPSNSIPYSLAQSVVGGSKGVLLDGGNATGGTLPQQPACTKVRISFGGTIVAGATLSLSATTVPNAASISVSITVLAGDTFAAIATRMCLTINAFANGAFAWAVVPATALTNVDVYFPAYPVFAWSPAFSGATTISVGAPAPGASAGRVVDARIRIVGDGPSATIFSIGVNDGRAFHAPNCENSSQTGETLFDLSSFAVISPEYSNGTAPTGVTGIELTGTSGPTRQISRVYLSDIDFVFRPNAGATGVKIATAQGNRLGRLKIVAAETGIWIDNSSDTTVIDCFISNGSGAAVKIVGRNWDPATNLGEGVFISNIDSNGQAIGLQIEDQSFGTATGCSFSTCAIAGLVMGRGVTGGRAEGWQFSGCQFGATLLTSWKSSATTNSPAGTPTLNMSSTNGLAVGMTPIATGIPASAVITNINSSTNVLTLSQNLTATIGVNAAIAIRDQGTRTVPATAAAAAGTTILTFASTAGLFVGMGVTNLNAATIPQFALVTAVTSTNVTLDRVLTGVGVAVGNLIEFTVANATTMLTSTTVAAGAPIPFATTAGMGLHVGMPVFGGSLDRDTFVTAIGPSSVTVAPVSIAAIGIGSAITFLRNSVLSIGSSAPSSGSAVFFSAGDVGGLSVGLSVYGLNVPKFTRIAQVTITGGTATVTLSNAPSATIPAGTKLQFRPASAASIDSNCTEIQFSGCYFFDAPVGIAISPWGTGAEGGGFHVIAGCSFIGLASAGIFVRNSGSCSISGISLATCGLGVVFAWGGFHSLTGSTLVDCQGGTAISMLGTVSCGSLGNTAVSSAGGLLMNGGGFHSIGSCSFNFNASGDIYAPSCAAAVMSAVTCLSNIARTPAIPSISDDPYSYKLLVNGAVVSGTTTLLGFSPSVTAVQTYP
jgi:hypothetical protein